MSSNQAIPITHSHHKLTVEFVIMTLMIGAIAFLAAPMGPLGGFWRPSVHSPEPTSAQLPFFLLLNVIESLVFGLGISFLVFGYNLIKRISNGSKTLTMAAFLSITWLLISWWTHDALHIHNGMDLGGLLLIEYGFHFTLMVAGLILAYFFWAIMRHREENN